MARYSYWEQNDHSRFAALKQHPLFTDHLLPDIEGGEVFPAIRKKKIDFYHVGRKLFSFDGKRFRSNIAYLVAYQNAPNGEVTEPAFKELKLCESFYEGYPQIKKNTKLYAEPESEQVARMWNSHSCFKKSNSGPIVVLDIELSLKALDEDRNQDRIDLVLLHLKERRIRFVEVKTFRNKELWPSPDGQIEVVGQIARYKKQIKQNPLLVSDYCQYVRLLFKLFGVKLLEPQAIDVDVDLLVTEYTGTDEQKIKASLLPAFGDTFRTNHRGNLSNTSQNALAKWWGNRKQSR